MNPDNEGSFFLELYTDNFNFANLCGPRTYTTTTSWVLITLQSAYSPNLFQLSIHPPNNLMTEGTYDIVFTVGLANYPSVNQVSQTLSISVLHPCKITQLSAPDFPDTFNYNFGADYSYPIPIVNSVNEAYG